jgi:hypothetical protein
MARAVGSCRSVLLVLALASCRRDEHAPAPSASVSLPGAHFAEQARERHLHEELTRASSRWQTKPSLGDCSAALKEKSDLELCRAAEDALAQVTAGTAPTPEATLTRLAPAALALARLSDRLRYLSMQELTERRIASDAGVAKAPPRSGAVTGPLPAAHAHEQQHAAHAEQRAVQLSEGPVSRELEVAVRLERDLIRNLGAYLEYGPLVVRRAAFAASKDLHAQHPRWPALARLLSEASVLESDGALKLELRELAATGAPQKPAAADQSAETK